MSMSIEQDRRLLSNQAGNKREHTSGANALEQADSAFALGVVLRDTRRNSEAVGFLARAFEIRTKELPNDHSDRVTATRTYAEVLRALGRHAEADSLQARGDAVNARR